MRKRKELGVLMSSEKVRAVLQLWWLGKTKNEVAREAEVSRAAVQDYVRRAQAAGLTATNYEDLSDTELLTKLGKLGGHRQRVEVEIDYAKITSELGKKGVTLLLLFQELLAQQKMPCSYQTFCRRVQQHERETGVVLRQHYAPGEYCLVDYAGLTVPIWNIAGTEILSKAQIFVAILGASALIFTEATESQEIRHFIGSHVRCFEFYGGSTLVLIPDNLKSAVTKSDRYDPELTRAYAELGEHYSTTILPARVRKPRDKGKVERAVLDVERWVIAPLRDTKFTSVATLNLAIKPLSDALNHKQMREYNASRWELFERLEKSALQPLPQKRYEATTLKLARVNIDYHVEFEKHFYSVPYQYHRQEVWIRASEHQVTIHLDSKCIATHARCRAMHRYSTVQEHMPRNHQAMRSRTASAFVDWAATVGPECVRLVERALSLGKHEQQAFRTILGMQRLVKSYSSTLFEAAAKEANGAGVASCKRVRGIIARQYSETLQAAAKPEAAVTTHDNLRGPAHYDGTVH